jgi:hypothetical protein
MPSPDKTEKKQRHRFQPGKSGNPNGRPRGSRNRTTQAVEALLDGEAEALTRKAIDMALGGDMQAIRVCMDRLCPPRKDRAVYFKLPTLGSAADAAVASAALVEAVANGDLTPGEAAELGKLVESYVRSLEATSLEERLSKLERLTAQ